MKYKSKPLQYSPSTKEIYSVISKRKDAIYFASTFEFRVYEQLVSLVGEKRIELQVPLKIKDATANYPELLWRCDFRIYHPENKWDYINIEAKGLPNREFKRNVQYLELFSGFEFCRLMVIGTQDSPKRLDKIVKMWTLPAAIEWLKTWLNR